jgi:hypothetical protein
MSVSPVRGMDIRAQARWGLLVGPTCGLAPDYLQANLVVVPKPWPRHVDPGADVRQRLRVKSEVSGARNERAGARRLTKTMRAG